MSVRFGMLEKTGRMQRHRAAIVSAILRTPEMFPGTPEADPSSAGAGVSADWRRQEGLAWVRDEACSRMEGIP